jgi:hypothetical protein
MPWSRHRALLVIAGAGFAYGLALQQRFRDVVPEAVRGQAFSLLSTGLMTAQGISPALAGALAGLLPVAQVIAVCGAVSVGAVLLFRLRAAEAMGASSKAVKLVGGRGCQTRRKRQRSPC